MFILDTEAFEKTGEAINTWNALGDVPVDDYGRIDEPFRDFEVGTDWESIWTWFEERHNISVGDLMCKRRTP